ncbi:GNAT family N-acetyltransferase [Desulfococcaceae bacterium HSG8]|nr:GNAT family N-acetyltransferase [Desulfococcaceae bacterium HSG8]
MKIKQADNQDIEQLAMLNAEVQAVHVNLFPSLFREASHEAMSKMLRQKLEDESTIILVAEDETQLAGYMILRKQILPEFTLINERKCGYIDQVCVSEKYRKKGIFRSLLYEAKRVVSEWGIDRIELDVWSDNQSARDAFIRSGFRTYNEKMMLNL